jgi:hypothetical protein
VHLIDQRIVKAHLVAVRQQLLGDMATDEPAAAGDKHSRHEKILLLTMILQMPGAPRTRASGDCSVPT